MKEQDLSALSNILRKIYNNIIFDIWNVSGKFVIQKIKSTEHYIFMGEIGYDGYKKNSIFSHETHSQQIK